MYRILLSPETPIGATDEDNVGRKVVGSAYLV